MDIAPYICDLLYKHDCVIVPGFGGFVATYAPAKIHPVTHTFYPPSKNILFNSKLTRDDGLLIDHISQKNKIVYEEAKKQLEVAAFQLKSRIDRKERVFLKYVGWLQLEPEGRIIFEPDGTINFLDDSFGLTSFVSTPIVRKGLKKRHATEFIDRRESLSRKNRVRKVGTYLAVILLLFASGWYGINQGLFRFELAEQANMVALRESVPDKPAEESLISGPVPFAIPLKDADFADPEGEEMEADKTGEGDEPIEQHTYLPIYHIIGGAFSNENNAEKLLVALRQKGFSAIRAGSSPSGLHMVSYLATHDKDEALLNLDIIQKGENPSAWLLKK
jgi:hypothetical protein